MMINLANTLLTPSKLQTLMPTPSKHHTKEITGWFNPLFQQTMLCALKAVLRITPRTWCSALEQPQRI